MSSSKFYIRFGLHRDRNMLRFLKDDYSGIVLPAHILAYSSKATIAALRYIDKPYFIDPMTYIYAKGFLDNYKVRQKEDQKDHLKPSIAKLTRDLNLTDVFPDIDTVPLDIADFNDDLIHKIAMGNVDLQLNRVNSGMDLSTPKLDTLLAEIGQPPSTSTTSFPPIFVTTPYFLIQKNNTKDWIDINVKLANETRKLTPKDIEVRPIILTHVDNLSNTLLSSYGDGFDNFITWVEDLDESKSCASEQALNDQVSKLSKFRAFVDGASESGKSIINLYGSYFSAILLKSGLEAFCNGPLYGEYKSSSASLGGIPPVRIYIPPLHRFYIYSQAVELIRLHPTIFESFPSGSRRLFKEPDELAKILGDVTLAQEHFINCRNHEIEFVTNNDNDAILEDLQVTHDSIGPFDDKPLKGKEPHQLAAWHRALS